MPDIAHAIVSLRPDACFTLDGNSYEGITWLTDDVPKPSKQEAEAELARLQAEHERTEYQRQRAAEYPPMADYIDGVVKGDQAQIDAYIAACMAVKAKYPKPE
jgi:hypothetical protein